MNPEMQYSQSGLALTKKYEGCRLTAYQDSGGVWTNGYGNTHGVVPGSTISQQQAEDDLIANVQDSVNDVNQLVTVQLTQGEFDALVDFDFNLGKMKFAGSTLLSLLNAGKFAEAAAQFDSWDYCDGTVMAGLLQLRKSETAEFAGSTNQLPI